MATRKFIVVSLGIFLGLLFYGLQTTLIYYNSLVLNEKPLKMFAVDIQKQKLSFMGKNYVLPDFDPIIQHQGIQPVRKELAKFKNVDLQSMTGDAYRWAIKGYEKVQEYIRIPPS